MAVQRTAANSPYTSLPEELQRVLRATYLAKPDFYRTTYPEQQVWYELREDRKRILVMIYDRMVAAGLWGHVDRIESVKCDLGDGVHFRTPDGTSLVQAIQSGKKFCRDPALGAALHPGQTSFRELVTGSGLHISTEVHLAQKFEGNVVPEGASEKFDVHLDTVAPVKLGPGLTCAYDVNLSIAHWGRDVIGKESGVEFFPDQKNLAHHPDPSQRDRDPSPELARVTLGRF